MGKGRAWVTDYGFAWQPAGATAVTQVQRTASVEGRAVLRIWTQHKDYTVDTHPGVEIYVSAGGRVIKVWDRKKGKWLVLEG